MHIKSILAGAAVVLAAAAGSVQAGEMFTTLGDAPAVKMTSDQMAEVRGADHVIRLIRFRTGKANPPTDASIAATGAAGSIGGAGNDRPAIVALLP